MNHKMKKLFIQNCFRFLIGTVLLISCFWYLGDHPAEKVALYSGFKNIIQKVEIVWYNLTGKKWDLLEKKYALENRFLELIHYAEGKDCVDDELIENLHNTYNVFLTEDKNYMEHYITKYQILEGDYARQIDSTCSR